jgi:hypothetical protein
MSRRIVITALAVAATGVLLAAASAGGSAAALLPPGTSAQKVPGVDSPGVLEYEEEWTRHNGWMRD